MFNRQRGILYLLLLMLILAACQAQDPLPTVIPPTQVPATPTEAAATASATLTRTPRPTLTPVATLPQTTSTDPDQQSYLRIIHAAPNTTGLDFYLDNLRLTSFLPYGQYVDRLSIVAGTYTLRALPAASTDLEQARLSQVITIRGRQNLNIVIYGTDDQLGFIISEEDTSPIPNNQSRFTLINAASGQFDLALFNGESQFSPTLAAGQVSNALTQPSQDYRFSLRQANQVLNEQVLSARARLGYTFVFLGVPSNPDTFRVLLLQTPLEGIASLRLVNMTLVGTLLDVYLGNNRLANALDYSTASPRQTLASGSYRLRVYAYGADINSVAPLLDDTISASAGDVLTLILTGAPNELSVTAFREDLSPTPPNQARISYMNTLSNVPRVQKLTNEEAPLDLRYREISVPQLIPSGAKNMSWERMNRDGTSDTLEITTNLLLEAGKSYLYLFAGRGTDGTLVLVTDVGSLSPTPAPELLATRIPAPQVRFINALDGVSINFRLNDIDIATLSPLSASAQVSIGAGQAIFTAHNADTNVLLARSLWTAPEATSLSAIIYATSANTYAMTVFESPLAQEQNSNQALVRFINISEGGVEFSLGFAPPSSFVLPEPAPALSASPSEGDGQAATQTNRLTIPSQVRDLASRIAMGQASGYQALEGGFYDLFLIHPNDATVETFLADVSLEQGRLYELVAYAAERLPTARLYFIPVPR